VRYGVGADSETGRLRTVLVHRPGPELKRITPRTRHLLESGALPWVARAQQEHDILTGMLRDHHAEVVYLAGLLPDVLEYSAARDEAISSVLASCELGPELGGVVQAFLDSLSPRDLARVLVAGLTPYELRAGRGLVYDLLGPHDFVIEPLPNLVFGKDASTWIGDQAVVGALPGHRRREGDLLAVIYGHHPRFAGLPPVYRSPCAPLDGGDVLTLGPGVVAIGVGSRTTAAGAESLARYLLDRGVADSVLVVPLDPADGGQAGLAGLAGTAGTAGTGRPAGHLDTTCTVLDHGVVLMMPALAFTLSALTITSQRGEATVARPRPFVDAAARALGVERLTVIHTGVDSRGSGGQWDNAGNVLALGDRVIVSDERNGATNARLTEAGFTLITVPNGEFGAARGGPRSMCVALSRDSTRPATPATPANPANLANPVADRRQPAPRTRDRTLALTIARADSPPERVAAPLPEQAEPSLASRSS
jgi:arginine deiminase